MGSLGLVWDVPRGEYGKHVHVQHMKGFTSSVRSIVDESGTKTSPTYGQWYVYRHNFPALWCHMAICQITDTADESTDTRHAARTSSLSTKSSI